MKPSDELAYLDKELITGTPKHLREKRTLNWYLDRALSGFENRSDRRLAEKLGISSSVINAYRHKNTFPSDEKMMEIAELAGVDPTLALLDLSAWRTKGTARLTYERLSQAVQHMTMAAIVLVLSAVPTSAKPLPAVDNVKSEMRSLYIM
jgi:transcriptional regulator with XRE-family HTH domain